MTTSSHPSSPRAPVSLRSESGFSLIELLIAMSLTAVGVAATLGVFGASGRTTLVAQQGQVGAHQAQAELDRLTKQLSYGELAMTSLPVNSTDPKNPNFRVSGGNFQVRPDLTEALITSAEAGEGDVAGVDPGPVTFAAEAGGSTITGKLYRYVTWRDENCPATICDDTENTKRVTVAATIDASATTGQRNPLWFSTVITDPSAAPPGYTGTSSGSGSSGGTNTSAQIFYLYDQACGSGTDGDHPEGNNHSTRNTAQQSTTGSDDSSCVNNNHMKRSDKMWLDPPEGSNPPMYEYSADLSGDYPGGLAMLTTGSSCRTNYSPTEAPVATGPNKWSVHAWATRRFDEDFHLAGRATVAIYTTTLGGLAGRGFLCASLLERSETGSLANDTVVASTTYDVTNWPTTTRRLSFSFTVSPQVDIDEDHRLVLVLHFRQESANDIAVLYDHPSYPSLLEVETTTPISSGDE